MLYPMYRIVPYIIILLAVAHSAALAFNLGGEELSATGSWKLYYIDQFGTRGNGDGQFIEPRGLAVDKEGHLYVADSGNCRVQVFDELGNFLFSFGSFGWEEDKLLYPTDCAVDEGLAVYVCDTDKSLVKKFSLEGMYQGTFGLVTDEGGIIQSTTFSDPMGCAVGRGGELLIADTANHRIHILDRLGSALDYLGGFGRGEGFFNRPEDVVVGPGGDIYVADTGNNCIQRFDASGNYKSSYGAPGETELLHSPCRIAVNPDGLLCIADRILEEVRITDRNFIPLLTIDAEDCGGLSSPEGVAISSDGTIYISDTYNHRILIYRISFIPQD